MLMGTGDRGQGGGDIAVIAVEESIGANSSTDEVMDKNPTVSDVKVSELN